MPYIAAGQPADDDPADYYDFNMPEDFGSTFDSTGQADGFEAAYAGNRVFDSGMYTDASNA